MRFEVAHANPSFLCHHARGYYDKYLSQPGFRGVKAGICYAHQLVGELPVEPHDVFMDYVVTDD